ncbi:MAG TPA: UdgX family uracil-DNA binding protein [Dongiaceae bacterium]|nr:UdgX family uracil-DNA binding protein [Dongiaceae bacterium]
MEKTAGGWRSLHETRDAALACRRCPLWKPATQTVFGMGPAPASIMFVGEQPGDKEDVAGAPFVGPAGAVLDRAIREAGLDREKIYVTNAVKHFKFQMRGKRRMHKKPLGGEIDACRWWLDWEVHFVEPRVIVALGATAARAVFRRSMPVEASRGRPFLMDRREIWVTVHPSYLLRLPAPDDRHREYERFVEDLRRVAGNWGE